MRDRHCSVHLAQCLAHKISVRHAMISVTYGLVVLEGRVQGTEWQEAAEAPGLCSFCMPRHEAYT